MAHRRISWLRIFSFILLAVCLATSACQLRPPPPIPGAETLFEGITYTREVRTTPRLMVVHLVQIDLRAQGLSLFVTPGDPTRDLPVDARTTSQFLTEFGVQLAINGDGFTPWSSNLLSAYPQPGDPVDPLGLAISNGIPYSQPRDSVPTLYITPNGKVTLNDPPRNIAFALSGLQMLVQNGNILPELDTDPAPRTALGLNRASKILTLLLVDGRQPGYSEGATLNELATLLLENGVHNGMNLDGGGSTTLVIEGENGPVILNSPIDGNFPGQERPVANHLGIFARPR
ncbi:MAG: phosphodiester glycosidase family protein [Anaerolineales bacterium]|nr:phosphodiester glycosidase family protein [Anaerolineales bacterium]